MDAKETPRRKKAVPPSAVKKRKAAAEPPADATGESKVPKKIKGATGGVELKKRKLSASRESLKRAAAPTTAQQPASKAGQMPLETEQVRKAVVALSTHLERLRAERAAGAKKALLDDEDENVYLVLATKQMPPALGKAKADKPVKLGLPHPFSSLENLELCLITKDPQREFKDKLATQNVRAKVIGISKLKKKYCEFEAKRQLCAAYDLFVADARVLPMLPPLLGKIFYKKKKLPVPINLKKKDLRSELEAICGGSFYRHSSGTSNAFKVGKISQGETALVDNVIAVVDQVVRLTPKKWSNVQALYLRSTNSVALPLYNSLPHAL
ncbi:hypothetical protein AB1Y20_014217 [Prymnesium parvum]|uniref:Ribosomal L1 domain-containing protein 1 n=1 Tax=Prymnesium parvum TaxID=97485 RepID=A0AB34IFL0_PRYPA|mmetsp:Transcript_1606/g.4059  ORF Transcript_1606/g.4059 Transcript_1606/m.4059 type:complete len:326 (-) Transcript_1606:248-1225(-)|eukprot:CAMPEP_0182810958 /NCGR_PEP_ID=MMETSP0006_2-20121128/8015_1 /TAXON_ID=97485 /ORGANISM="Prymnesium parvum, Strain Texoma1" /LENGTH=325 /DNA_ID=CAMNT_0024936885 /DNA_START=136 /DNA_END=1113 /DNA_ORIENTATION=+